MRKTLAMSETYRSVITRMNRTDGIVAIGVFVALLALYTGHEQLMLSGILRTRAAFNASQIAVAIIGLTVVAVVLRLRRQDLASVGLRREGLRRSLMLGLAAAGVLSAANVGLAYWQGARHLNTLEAIAQMTALFAFFAAEEELIWRGYLTARLHGLISRTRVAQLLGVLFFVAVHLPGFLLPSPAEYLATFDPYDALRLAILLLVGYVYDTLYRATGSIAGCTAAHFLVNVSNCLLV